MVSLATSLGINCRGSTNCLGTSRCQLTDLILAANDLEPTRMFAPGEHIACCGSPGAHICAFVQSTSESISAEQAVAYMQALRGHNCKQCGSVPFKDNNVAYGQLTVNWISG